MALLEEPETSDYEVAIGHMTVTLGNLLILECILCCIVLDKTQDGFIGFNGDMFTPACLGEG